MQEIGLVEAGYNILILDDCYALKERNATGHMVADLGKFLHGIEALSSHVNHHGVQLAAHGDNVYQTCAVYPGSYGRELQDLQTWHSWGMSYLKYDDCYLTKASKQSLDILGNRDLIKINQDPDVGESISPFRWGVNADYTFNATHPAEYWSGNTSYGIVFMILNSQDTTQEMSFNLTESWAIRAGRQYSVYDLWSHEDVGIAVRNISMKLPAHGVSALLLNDAGPEPQEYDASCGFFYQCSVRLIHLSSSRQNEEH
ncbi:hypothetical protein D0861_02785 [Hortaea werneckii]|uniref:Alpha-galactosidase n=1 Tax=Hortaea werneckii TaxID=91943 RepID=A0A3M7FTB4_HORWE|nr:hypothetical protein D0861_02785 [Hortaea werneckii]